MSWHYDGATPLSVSLTAGSWTTLSTGIADKIVVLRVAAGGYQYWSRIKGSGVTVAPTGSDAHGCAAAETTASRGARLIVMTDGSGDVELDTNTSHDANFVVEGSLDYGKKNTICWDTTVPSGWQSFQPDSNSRLAFFLVENLGTKNVILNLAPHDIHGETYDATFARHAWGAFLVAGSAAYMLVPSDDTGKYQIQCSSTSQHIRVTMLGYAERWVRDYRVFDWIVTSTAWRSVLDGTPADSFDVLVHATDGANSRGFARDANDSLDYRATPGIVGPQAANTISGTAPEGVLYARSGSDGKLELASDNPAARQLEYLYGYVPRDDPPTAIGIAPYGFALGDATVEGLVDDDFDVDFSSINMTVNGYNVVVGGVAQPGWNVAIVPDGNGYIVGAYPDTPLPRGPASATLSAKDSNGASCSTTWAWTVVDAPYLDVESPVDIDTTGEPIRFSITDDAGQSIVTATLGVTLSDETGWSETLVTGGVMQPEVDGYLVPDGNRLRVEIRGYPLPPSPRRILVLVSATSSSGVEL